METVLEVIERRSSTRDYYEDKLSKEELDTILKAGLLAPTARNEQELHLTVLDTGSEIVQEMCHDLDPEREPKFYYGAPTLIIVSGLDSFPWTSVDAGIAVENMHLASIGLGLGSVVIGCISRVMESEKKAHYDEALKLPEGYSFKVALAVGKMIKTKTPHEINFERDVTVL